MPIYKDAVQIPADSSNYRIDRSRFALTIYPYSLALMHTLEVT